MAGRDGRDCGKLHALHSKICIMGDGVCILRQYFIFLMKYFASLPMGLSLLKQKEQTSCGLIACCATPCLPESALHERHAHAIDSGIDWTKCARIVACVQAGHRKNPDMPGPAHRGGDIRSVVIQGNMMRWVMRVGSAGFERGMNTDPTASTCLVTSTARHTVAQLSLPPHAGKTASGMAGLNPACQAEQVWPNVLSTLAGV